MKHVINKVTTHHLQLSDVEMRLLSQGIQNLRNIREEVGALEESGIDAYTDETEADFAVNTFHDTIKLNLLKEDQNV